jgi:tight adherence protein B
MSRLLRRALRLAPSSALVRAAIGLVALLPLLAASQTASAASVQVTPADAVFPQRALVVSGTGLGGLTAGRVRVVENGVPVRAVSVRSLEQPSANDSGVVLVIDVSPHVSSIEHAVAAARVLASKRPSREVLGIVEADAQPPVSLSLTTDPQSISSALAKAPVMSRHGLHMYDAVLSALGMLRSAHVAAGSVIVLSDGADRGDARTLRQIANVAGGGHIRIFAVGIPSPHFDGHALTALAGVSGGQFVKAGSARLSQVFGAIQTRLADQYLIRYFSSQSAGRRIPASIRIDGIPGTFDISYSTPPVGAGSLTAHSLRHETFWTSTGAALLVSLACALLLGLAILLLISRREAVAARVGGFVNPSVASPPKQRSLVQRALGDPRLRRGERLRWLDALALEFDIARIKISPGRLALLTLGGMVVLGWLLVGATSSAAAALLALAVPVAVVVGIRFQAGRQRREFEQQLPENLQVIASALRAGHTFLGSLGVMAEDAPEPSRRELRRALADEQLGVPLVDALQRVGTRMKSVDFQQVTLVATLQRDSGGNTAEVIDVVSDTIRDRLDLRRLVRSLTAQGRLAGLMLSGLPVLLLIAISLINPGYIKPLFHTILGIIALTIAGVMVTSGSLIIKRIVNIEV